MNETTTTQNRTIPRHPYDRAKDLNGGLSLDMLAYTLPIGVGSVDDFCEYIIVCHDSCNRRVAQSCSNYTPLYELWLEIQQDKQR